MIKLYDVEITDLLPENLKSNEVIAYSYAFKKACRYVLDRVDRIELYTNIDKLPENILDYLALELRTQYYDEDLNITVKRELIKNTLPWYMKAGTAVAVSELLTTVIGSGSVQEWFEYGGDPYMFKITTREQLTRENIEKFAAIIDNVKNARSKLDGFDKEELITMNANIGCGLCINKFIRVGGELCL
ncbi:phage tail protein, P2 protein I family [Anaerosporobacter mobilis DSM 15930]|uniref:Phage tail protein, P2 protein I family n=1 Tax=Anaerosporobacter mobilis DSM 15930 TaxID=1120996 RepID=A0A1M7LUF7_9FIRM|nr:phage tail protein I [Anaerosporobacter mobilis]SHM81957.1 phage tail protein, P2 protein I family [Anaerosporobacter mobilis DSM 15930]